MCEVHASSLYYLLTYSYHAETTFSTDRQTDRQTDMVKPVYPPPHNFVDGGIKIIHANSDTLSEFYVKSDINY